MDAMDKRAWIEIQVHIETEPDAKGNVYTNVVTFPIRECMVKTPEEAHYLAECGRRVIKATFNLGFHTEGNHASVIIEGEDDEG